VVTLFVVKEFLQRAGEEGIEAGLKTNAIMRDNVKETKVINTKRTLGLRRQNCHGRLPRHLRSGLRTVGDSTFQERIDPLFFNSGVRSRYRCNGRAGGDHRLNKAFRRTVWRSFQPWVRLFPRCFLKSTFDDGREQRHDGDAVITIGIRTVFPSPES